MIKWFVGALGAVVVTVAGLRYYVSTSFPRYSTSPPLAQVSSPAPLPSPSLTRAPPSRLSIPKLGVSAPVEEVGLTLDKRMAVPQEWMSVGWYMYGPRPGELGNSVIAGHLDSPTGPAIFYRLRQLEAGDKVVVGDTKGVEYTFTVTGKESYPDATFPVAQVFGSSNESRLVLITCEGTFDRSARNYSDRLVVFADLDQ